MTDAGVLEEPIQGALVEEGVPICSAALVRLFDGVAYVAVPSESGLPSDFHVVSAGVALTLVGGASTDVTFGYLPAALFSDLDSDLDEVAVRFSSAGDEVLEWPEPAALLAAIPAAMRPEPVGAAAAGLEEGLPRGRGRAAAGRGRGGPPPAVPPPGPGAGRGRVTLASVADQMGQLILSFQGVQHEVASLSLRVADIEAGGARGMPDLFGNAGASAPVGRVDYAAEVASRRAGGPSLGAAQPPPTAGYVRRPPPRDGDGDARPRPAVGPQPPPGLATPPVGAGGGRPGSSGASAEVSGTTLAAMLAEQTAVLKRLRRQDGEEDDPEEELRLPGAKGAAAMDALMRRRATKPTYFVGVVEEALRRLAAQQPGAASSPAPSARAYAGFSIPFMAPGGPMRTLGYLTWGVSTAWDELYAGETERALCTLSLLLVACEQAALDEGAWSLAWLLSLQPDPPWSTMLRRADAHALRPYAKLADTRWVSASLSFLRDVERIKAARREAKPGAPEKAAWGEDAPKGGPKGPGKGKLKGGTKDVPPAGA